MIKLPLEVKIEEAPLEVMYRSVLRGLLTRIKTLYEEIHKRFGDQGLNLIHEVSERSGTEIAKKVRGNDDAWGIKQVGLFLVKMFNNMRSDGKVTEFGNDRIAIMVPRCPYPFEDTKICSAHTAMECSLVKGLNPDLEYRIEKSIPAGDPVCLHVLTKNTSKKMKKYKTLSGYFQLIYKQLKKGK